MKSEQKSKNGAIFVVATSEDTKGGISAVISSYKKSYLWSKWDCVWIESTNGNLRPISKILNSLFVYFKYLLTVKSCRLVHIHVALRRSAFRKCFYYYPAKWLKRPIIVHLHAPSMTPEFAKLQFARYSTLFNGADIVLALSDSWRDIVQSYLPSANVKVLRNSVRLPKSIIQYDSREENILFLGWLTQMKGYRDLLHAFAAVAKQFPRWKLHLAGHGELEEAIEISRELKISDQVVVHGWVAGEKKIMLLNQAKVFCLPSYAEAFPVSVLEALSYGVPVVTTPVGAMKTEFTGVEGVTMVLPGDINSLSNVLHSLMSSSPRLTRMSLCARNLAEERFSYDQMISRLDSFYSMLIGNK